MSRIAVSGALFALLVALGAPVVAQEKWPTKPIEMVYPYPPGNMSDVVMRVYAQAISRQLNVPVQLINKPGGGGVVGTVEALQAKPDGYSVVVFTSGNGISQVVTNNAPYKLSDFAPIAGVFVNDFVLAGRSNLPVDKVEDLAGWAKTHGKPPVIGSFSPASTPGLATARVVKRGGWTHKPIAFPNPTAKELLAGDADLVTTSAELLAPFVKSGQVKAFVAMTPTRIKQFPNVPTVKEAGYGELYAWTGLAASAKVPPDVLSRLREAAAAAMQDKEVIATMERLNIIALPMTSAEMSDRMNADARWMSEVASETGLVKK